MTNRLFIHLCALLFSVLFDASFGFALRPVYALSVYLLIIFCARYRFIYIILLSMLCILSATWAPASFLYGAPTVNTLAAILDTNLAESLEFIIAIPAHNWLYSLLLIGLTAGLLFNRQRLQVKHNKLLLALALLGIIYRPVISWAKSDEVRVDFTPVKFLQKFHHAYRTVSEENSRLKVLMQLPADWRPTPASDEFDSYIMVIGESVRADFMSLYGFPVNNTPFLNRLNGTVFNRYITAAGSTQQSLTASLALPGAPQNNLVRLAQKQGLESWWISNQGSHGADDAQVSLIGKLADQAIFLKRGEYNTQNKDDPELLPHLHRALAQKQRKQLIVLHLMGSHSDYCQRTHDSYDSFFINRYLSCYVQSIKQTDRLLEDIVQAANQHQRKWTLLYFADHGLAFSQDKINSELTLIHGAHTRQNFNVPLFISAWNASEKKVVNSYYSAFNFLSLYLNWTGSQDPLLAPGCDILRETQCPDQQVEVIGFDQNRQPYQQLEDRPASWLYQR